MTSLNCLQFADPVPGSQTSQPKMRIIYQVTKLSVLLFLFPVSQGADWFESLLVRLICFEQVQPGCDSSFPEAYPEYGMSKLNLTNATTHVYLFTQKNPDKPENVHMCGGKIPPNSNFNPHDPCIFIIPGFTSGQCNYAIFRKIKNELLKRGPINCFLVDWMWGNTPDLIQAYNNMPIMAAHVAIVIDHIKEVYGVPVKNITCLGHSYGAHGCGLISQRSRCGVIVGTDPSGIVTTESTPLDKRLDASDADCVQAIHTNGGQCLPNYFGANFSCGTVDIWVNGGLHQPNCYINTLQAFMEEDYIFGIFSLLPAACSHFQALQYYKASINPSGCEFVGVQCESSLMFELRQCRQCQADGENCVIMGEGACDCYTAKQLQNEGVNYYVQTKPLCPYCDNTTVDANGKACFYKDRQ